AAFWVSVKSPSTSAGTAPDGLIFRYSGLFSRSPSISSTSNGWPVHCRAMWSAVEHAPGLLYSFMGTPQRCWQEAFTIAEPGARGNRARANSPLRLAGLEALHLVEGV